ncbi:hypothetical protein M1E08_17480 [Erwinia sp. PK3-005]
MAKKGKLIYIKKGDFCIIKDEEAYYISILFPNFFRNSHFDISKVFLLDIREFIERRDFEKLALIAEDIRKNYENYKGKEVEEVEIIKKELIK